MGTLNPALWIRHGDTTDAANDYRALTSAPTASTDGIPVPADRRESLAHLKLTHSAAGARTFTVDVWGYKPGAQILLSSAWVTISGAAEWAHIGSFQVDESGDGSECHLLEAISGFTRLAAQVSSSSGSPDVWTDFGFAQVAREEVS